jgi:hypothetical protein
MAKVNHRELLALNQVGTKGITRAIRCRQFVDKQLFDALRPLAGLGSACSSAIRVRCGCDRLANIRSRTGSRSNNRR